MYTHHVMELTPELFFNKSDDNDNKDKSTISITTIEPLPPIEFTILILKAYILGTMKCSHLVWEEMSKGHVYDVRLFLFIFFFCLFFFEKEECLCLFIL